MAEVLQANVFFFITSVAVIVFTVLLCVALYHLIKILKAVRDITERIKSGSEVIAKDAARIREGIISGNPISKVISSLFGSAKEAVKKRTKRSKSNLHVNEEE